MNIVNRIEAEWEHRGEVSSQEAATVYKHLDEYLENQFSEIGNLINNNKPEAALAMLTQTTGFLSAAATKVPRILAKLQNAINKYLTHLNNLAKNLNADSFTISAGFPSGISLSLTWNT